MQDMRRSWPRRVPAACCAVRSELSPRQLRMRRGADWEDLFVECPLGRWDGMVQRVCTEACEADAESQTDWLLLAGNRGWLSAHEAVCVQRVPRRHAVCRPAPGRFMLHPSGDSEALELAAVDA